MARARRGRGEGSIEVLPSGKFRAVRSWGVNPQTGKQLKESRTFDTKRAAWNWLHDKSTNGRGERARRPLSAWLAHWLELKKPSVEPATHVWYERRVRLHLSPARGSTASVT